MVRSFAVLACLASAGAPASADEPGGVAKERLRQMLREIIERQRQIRAGLVEKHPP